MKIEQQLHQSLSFLGIPRLYVGFTEDKNPIDTIIVIFQLILILPGLGFESLAIVFKRII